MKRAISLAALVAMVPAMIGPLQASARTVAIPLCNGGTASIPLDAPKLPGEQGPCCAKGCHGGNCQRKRLDRTQ